MTTSDLKHRAQAPDLLGLGRRELGERLAELIDRPYRVDQLFQALHERRVERFDDVTELGLALRRTLAERFRIGYPTTVERVASVDGTCKYLFRLTDGATIEAVDIPDGNRRTLCLSSQAGCALGCTFCVTGYWGAGRDLDASEIVAQVYAIRNHPDGPSEDRGLNLVFMGMGEPLLNLDAVRRSLDLLTRSISWRRITVSTAGVVPGIDEMAGWPRRPNLALSLHAPDDRRRAEIMPINRKYPLAEVMAALRRFPLERGRRLTFEYTLIEGFNDRRDDPRQLAKLLQGLRAKVNLIPLNPDPVLGDLRAPSWDEVEHFRRALVERGVPASVRRPRGDDVAAACGQLRAFGREPRRFPSTRVSGVR